MYVCASGATPIAAALISAGLSPGAGLAFLLCGPSTNGTTFGLLTPTHGKIVALLFGTAMLTSASLIGWFAEYFLTLSHGPPPLAYATNFGILSHISAVGMAALFMFAVFRRGPRALLKLAT